MRDLPLLPILEIRTPEQERLDLLEEEVRALKERVEELVGALAKKPWRSGNGK